MSYCRRKDLKQPCQSHLEIPGEPKQKEQGDRRESSAEASKSKWCCKKGFSAASMATVGEQELLKPWEESLLMSVI